MIIRSWIAENAFVFIALCALVAVQLYANFLWKMATGRLALGLISTQNIVACASNACGTGIIAGRAIVNFAFIFRSRFGMVRTLRRINTPNKRHARFLTRNKATSCIYSARPAYVFSVDQLIVLSGLAFNGRLLLHAFGLIIAQFKTVFAHRAFGSIARGAFVPILCGATGA